MNPPAATVPILPGPGVSPIADVPGARYIQSAGGRPVPAQPEHVEALQALGWITVTPAPAITSAPNPALAAPNHRPLINPRLMVRMFPLPGHPHRLATVEGRTYEVPEGQAYLDVPVEDARPLSHNGWLDAGPCGPSEGRPADPLRGFMFTDTTIGLVLIFDGLAWRDFITGEAY